jgi:uncharacterized protein
MANPGVYFEIAVTDLQRAMRFYSAVFGFDFVEEDIHGNRMAHLPFHDGARGIAGALAQGETYRPSLHGSLVYLHVDDIAATLQRAALAGGRTLFPRTRAGDHAWVAEIEDCEGNRIGLSEPIR